MNRRRIGLGILAAGAGLAARRRLRSRLDPGTGDLADLSLPVEPVDTATANSFNAVEADLSAVSADEVGVNAVEADLSADEVGVNAVEADLSADEVGVNAVEADLSADEVRDGEPAVSLSTSDADVQVDQEPAGDEPMSSAALIEAGRNATSDPDGLADAVSLEPAAALAPIVLPTMPRAGTNEIPNPDVVIVPKADGSSPAFVSPSAVSTSGPSTTTPRQTSQSALSDAGTESAAPAIDAPAAIEAPDLIEPVPASSSSLPLASPNYSDDQDAADQSAQQVKWYRRRFYGWSVPVLMLLGLLGVAAFVASVVPLPYYRISPGKVYDTVERVDVPGELAFVPDGEIGFVTVARTADITALQWLDAKLDKNVRIRHEDEIRGTQSLDEARATDLRRMQVSKDSAVVVVLERLGYELISTPVGVEVARVFACTAADGTLGTGDLIVGVNGVATPDGQRLVDQLISIGVGEEVELLVERIDPANPAASIRTDLVGLTLGSADDPCIEDGVRADEPRPFIGIQTATMFEEELPLDVDVRTGTVGGPSAGLAFTLAIMDVLSEGELTNGLNIVATGSIGRDERIGPVGAIHQKTIAAERSGADLFLVPACCDNFVDRTTGEDLELPSNIDEALMYADEMRVVGVDTLEDALRAIGEMGGNVDRFLDS